jgi:moderate conductance mechanosensitive channel
MLDSTEGWPLLVKVTVIFLVAVILTIIVRRATTKRASRMLTRFGTVSTDPVREAARVKTLGTVTRSALIGAIWITAILAIFQVLNQAFSSFVLAITLLGSALTFGAQSLIRDVLSGFFILLEDQYAVGDQIDLGLASGTVERVTLRVTRLRDATGEVWWVPNGQIARAGNMTQDWARAVIDVALARESDAEQATATVIEIAEQTVARPDLADRVLEPPTAVGLIEVSDHRLVIRATVKVAKGAQADVRRAVQTALLTAFKDGRLISPPVIDHPGGGAGPSSGAAGGPSAS